MPESSRQDTPTGAPGNKSKPGHTPEPMCNDCKVNPAKVCGRCSVKGWVYCPPLVGLAAPAKGIAAARDILGRVADWECDCDMPDEGESGVIKCLGCEARAVLELLK